MQIEFKQHQLVVAGLSTQIDLLNQRCGEHQNTIRAKEGAIDTLQNTSVRLKKHRELQDNSVAYLLNEFADPGKDFVFPRPTPPVLDESPLPDAIIAVWDLRKCYEKAVATLRDVIAENQELKAKLAKKRK